VSTNNCGSRVAAWLPTGPARAGSTSLAIVVIAGRLLLIPIARIGPLTGDSWPSDRTIPKTAHRATPYFQRVTGPFLQTLMLRSRANALSSGRRVTEAPHAAAEAAHQSGKEYPEERCAPLPARYRRPAPRSATARTTPTFGSSKGFAHSYEGDG
jgi:hypothetical protein